MSINWDDVVPGKTVLVNGTDEYKIIGVWNLWVWVAPKGAMAPIICYRYDFKYYHIKKEWVEVTGECGVMFHLHSDSAQLMHKGIILHQDDFLGSDPSYKRDGLRIFKRGAQ